MVEKIRIPVGDKVSGALLEEIANVDALQDQYGKPYEYIRRSVVPLGLLAHQGSVLKLYHMLRENVALPQNLVDGLEEFIKQEISAGSVVPTQQVGFAILSQGFLSINLWGRGNVLFTHAYTVEKTPPNLSREPLETTGVACTWEAKIMSFEYDHWQEYLGSRMGVTEKKRYLESFISGPL